MLIDADLNGSKVATWWLHGRYTCRMVEKVNITAGRVSEFKCASGKAQDFLRDLKSPWLAVRATASGAKSFVFEAKLNGRTIRGVIGGTNA